MQIQDGQRVLDRLVREGVGVTAAAWIKESESGQWYLYLGTPLVSEDGGKRPAYHRVNTVIRAMQKEGFWFDPFQIKVIGPHNPIAKDLAAQRQRRPPRVPTWFSGHQLGELAVEGAWIYPPAPNPEEATGVSKS